MLFGSSTSFATFFVNSLVITLPAVVIPISLALLASYAFAWIDFKGRNLLFVAVFALQVVPIQVTLIPLLSQYVQWGVNGSFWAIWLSHSIFALPLAIFLLHNFMKDIPPSLVEAARVDGAGHVKIFFQVLMPLLTPAIASFAIFQFLWVWNDLLVVADLRQHRHLPAHGAHRRARGNPRLAVAPAVSGCIRVDDRPADRVLGTSAVLCEGTPRGVRQRLSAGPLHRGGAAGPMALDVRRAVQVTGSARLRTRWRVRGTGPGSDGRPAPGSLLSGGPRRTRPGGSTRCPACICWSCAWAAICCATIAVCSPWNRPSSHPTSWACAMRSSRLRGHGVVGEGQRDAVQLGHEVGGEAVLELGDGPLVHLGEPGAGRLVEGRAAHLLEQTLDHLADPQDLRGLVDDRGPGPLVLGCVRCGGLAGWTSTPRASSSRGTWGP